MNAAKLFVLAALLVVAHTADYKDAVLAEGMRTEHRYVTEAPRCPKANAAYQTLRYEIAQRADDGDWTLDCVYTED